MDNGKTGNGCPSNMSNYIAQGKSADSHITRLRAKLEKAIPEKED
jgi:hypothetical protein